METRLSDCVRVVLLDNGLRRVGDHSFAIARGLTRELKNYSGMDCAIYCSREMNPGLKQELSSVPHFEHSLYDAMPPSQLSMYRRRCVAALKRTALDESPSEKCTSAILNDSFRADLERLPEGVWARGTIVLFPGLFQHQILGLAAFIQTHAAHIGAKIVCQLMFETSWLPWGKRSQFGEKTYRAAFSRLRPFLGKTISFTAENSFVREHYRRKFGVPIEFLPLPLGGNATQPGTPNLIRIGFFGYSKIEKGFDLLPAAIAKCCAYRNDLKFVVQVQHHDQEPPVVAAERALRSMGTIRLLEGALEEDVFAAEAASVDIILLPYHPVLFGRRGSGIFIEAVTAGRLIVASQQTWAGGCIESGEAVGEAFAPHASDALADAVLRLCDVIDRKRPLALDQAPKFASTHSMPSYVRRLLAVAGIREPPIAGVA